MRHDTTMDVKMTQCYTQQSKKYEQKSKLHFCTSLSEQSLFCKIMNCHIDYHQQDVTTTTLYCLWREII